MGRVTRTAGPAAPLLKTIIEGFGDLRLRVGFFDTARYPDGTPVAYVAAIHEFGAPGQGIPPRPFMRPAAEQNGPEWNRQMAAGAAAVARGAYTPQQVLDQIGGLAAGNVSEAIAAVTAPPLKEATIEAKARKYADGGAKGPGSLGKPLVESGLLIQSPTYVVDRGE